MAERDEIGVCKSGVWFGGSPARPGAYCTVHVFGGLRMASAGALFVVGLVKHDAHPARHPEVGHETESGVHHVAVELDAPSLELRDRGRKIVAVEGDVVGSRRQAVATLLVGRM